MINNKGSTILITPIIWVITIFIFIFFIVFSVKIMEPFMIYQKISGVTLKYIFVMEEFGFLTKEDKEQLISELVDKGLLMEKIAVEATDEKVDYGEVVELNITYDHPYKEGRFDNSLIPRYGEEIIKICVSKKGVSKR